MSYFDLKGFKFIEFSIFMTRKICLHEKKILLKKISVHNLTQDIMFFSKIADNLHIINY